MAICENVCLVAKKMWVGRRLLRGKKNETSPSIGFMGFYIYFSFSLVSQQPNSGGFIDVFFFLFDLALFFVRPRGSERGHKPNPKYLG